MPSSRGINKLYGGGLPVFTGYQYGPQVGSGLFGSIFRTVLPMVKNVGRSVLKHGLAALAQGAGDVIDNKATFKDAAIGAAKKTVRRTTRDVA
jgi:hypothetical protein